MISFSLAISLLRLARRDDRLSAATSAKMGKTEEFRGVHEHRVQGTRHLATPARAAAAVWGGGGGGGHGQAMSCVGENYVRGVESALDLLLGRLPPALVASEARRLQKLESRSNGTPLPRYKIRRHQHRQSCVNM